MEKPIGWDDAQPQQFSSNERPAAGAYVMKILDAKYTTSGNGRPMIVYMMDIAQGAHTGTYKKLFDYLKKSNADAKWPCIMRRCTDGNQTAYFKGDIKSIEDSNAGFKFDFNESKLKGKLVGCILGEKEIDASGKTILEPRWLCSTEKATSGTMKAPAIKKYEGSQPAQRQPGEDSDSLPF